MTQNGPLARLVSRSAEAEFGVADLLDPVRLESRLVEARARRAAALARRRSEVDGAVASEPQVVATAPLPEDPAVAEAAQQPRRPLLPLTIFLAGLCLGAAAAAVLSVGALREREAALVTPAPPAAVAPDGAAQRPEPTLVALVPPVADTEPPAAPATPPAESLPEPEDPPARPLAETTAAPPPDWAATARVNVYFPPDARDTAEAAAAALGAAGVAGVTIAPARFSVARTNVRFYHGADQATAEGVAGIVAEAYGGEAEARDFTDFSPTPRLGMVEVWLSGDAPAGGTRRRAPSNLPAAAQDVAEQVARIVVLRTLERLGYEPPRR